MKRMIRWFGIILTGIVMVMLVVTSVASIPNTYADTVSLGTDDLETIKQNALYKSIYSNLTKCYSAMQDKILESPESTWASFDSNTYFSDSALASDYLKFPYGVGSQNQSSCPKMITGWKTNWFINLFTGTGSYSGVLSLNVNAEVPDSTWYDRSTTKMGDFLKNIGYTEKTEADGTLSNRSCFYLKFKLNQSTYDNNWLARPASGEYFETVDYCVKLNDNGTLNQNGDSIIALIGNNEYFTFDYDNGHLTDESNIAFIYFDGPDDALAPQFRVVNDENISFSGKNYLQSNLDDYIDLRYYHASEYGNSLEARSLSVKNIDSKSHATEGTYCSDLGYRHCGWYDAGWFSSTIYIGSLMDFGGTISYSEFKSRMANLINKAQDDDGYYLFSGATAVDYNPVDRRYEKSSSNSKFINYFIGDTSRYNGGKFSEAEKYMLYYTYLKDNYNVASSETEAGSNSVLVSWLNSSDGTFSKLYIYDPDENLSDKKYILDNNGKWDGATMANWHEIAELLAAIDVESAFDGAELTEPIIDPGLEPEPSPEESGTSDLAECFNNASSLGWILCPVLKFVGVAADGLWQEISEHWLVTDYEQYQANDSNGVYVAWGSIRNLANIVFAMILLVVIISQLTGLGISNYGIKKILPTLIMIIVLVNISFLICQLLIDISNVVGGSIEGIADFIRSKIPSSSSVGIGDVFRGTLASLFEAAGIAGIGAGGYVLVKMGGASVLIPLLISIVGVLISIVFAFIILAVRQAGILVLVVISPLAIICYALPNTKNLFDKWKKLFTSLLFIYPVCAVCIYGGQVVSSLMLASENTGFMFNLVAMLLQIVPIFFIPSLIRGSLALAGNIGNRISQVGRGLSNRATGALQRSEAVERARTTGQFRAAQRNRDFFNRLSKRKGVLGAVGRYGNRRMDSAAARYNKMRLDEHQASLYGRSINEDSISRSLASLDIKDMERRVTEDMDNLVQSDASKTGIDTTDVKSINAAFQAALAEADADPTNETKMIRAKALASLLMGKGDTGQSSMIESMRDHVNATTGVGAKGSEAMRSLGGYVSYNDKWMASIKGKDTGAYKFMNDLAASQNIKSNSDYAMAGAEKVTQSTIGGMGDSWYRSMETALGDGSFNASTDNQDALRTYADLATKALTDPRYAGTIQKERLDTLNKLREAAYNLDKQKWVAANAGKTEADYEREFGKFQKINNPGDEIKIAHPKIKMPAGWRQATATDAAISNPNLHLKEGEWINANGNVIRRLNAEQTLQAQEIQRRNANIDVDNMQA